MRKAGSGSAEDNDWTRARAPGPLCIDVNPPLRRNRNIFWGNGSFHSHYSDYNNINNYAQLVRRSRLQACVPNERKPFVLAFDLYPRFVRWRSTV